MFFFSIGIELHKLSKTGSISVSDGWRFTLQYLRYTRMTEACDSALAANIRCRWGYRKALRLDCRTFRIAVSNSNFQIKNLKINFNSIFLSHEITVEMLIYNGYGFNDNERAHL